jgi:hypothetical protein
MDLIGAFIGSFRASLPDFKMEQDFRGKSYIIFSKDLNQIICIKYIQRKDCITRARAHQYLEVNRREMQRKVGMEFYRKAFILNVLIADCLSKNCYELVSNPAKEKLRNMDMVFSINRTPERRIIDTVLRALITKLERWRDDLLKSCRAKNVKKPYGPLKKKITAMNDAIHELTKRRSRYMRGESYG